MTFIYKWTIFSIKRDRIGLCGGQLIESGHFKFPKGSEVIPFDLILLKTKRPFGFVSFLVETLFNFGEPFP